MTQWDVANVTSGQDTKGSMIAALKTALKT